MEDEDDYLSNKFLVDTSAHNAPKTYAQRRKEADRQSRLKNEQNRLKSRQQRELESREEGLRKSLFERAKEVDDAGLGQGNKALGIMIKMGFKPGQALGKSEGNEEDTPGEDTPLGNEETPAEKVPSKAKHKVEPLPINEEWIKGKKGIGLGKRAPSPGFAERAAKLAKMAEASSKDTFRDRTRREYEDRRAEGRLLAAQRTCTSLDEQTGRSFNVLWLNPQVPESIPKGLMDGLSDYASVLPRHDNRMSTEARLRLQMQSDALRPRASTEEDDDEEEEPTVRTDLYNAETIQEAVGFLRLDAPDRLRMVLSYLRTKYAYCFWCGTRYEDEKEMNEQCPGSDEDAHD